MITQRQCRKILDTAVQHGRSRADGVEVHVMSSDVATSRFANNGMTQNQSPMRTEVSVRVLVEGRQARLSTDDITPAGIRGLVDNAVKAAGLLEKDPQLQPLYTTGTEELQQVNRFDPKTARFGPLDRAAAINSIIEQARARNLNASGVYVTGTNVLAIGNSAGLFRFYRETEAECSVTMTGEDSSGWAKAHAPSVKMVDARALGQSAADKAIASARPIDLDPGRYTVILEPSAVLDLLGYLWHDFTGTSHTDKLSCFLDKVGQKLLGDNVTVYDDVRHRLQSGAPFDGEGVPRQTLTLVDSGVIKHLVHGRRNARLSGVHPTGHGLMEPSTIGEYPGNIVVSGGTTSLEDMIKSTDRGILLTRVWYVREVDPTTKIITGMTRDGTFLVEDGKIKCGIRNFRFNQSIIEMLNNVMALGPSVRAAGEEALPAVVPAMKVANFNFSSATRF